MVGAAFSGFEGALIAIALNSFLGSPIITGVICALILGIIIFAQTRRWIEKFDLLLIPVITLAVILFVPFLQGGITISQIILLAVAGGLAAIAVTSIYRIIYQILSLIFNKN